MKIGVLALQGAFAEHIKMLEKLGVESFEIRKKNDLDNAVNNNGIDGLIIPGGESTVIGKLLYDLDLFNDIKKLILNKLYWEIKRYRFNKLWIIFLYFPAIPLFYIRNIKCFLKIF